MTAPRPGQARAYDGCCITLAVPPVFIFGRLKPAEGGLAVRTTQALMAAKGGTGPPSIPVVPAPLTTAAELTQAYRALIAAVVDVSFADLSPALRAERVHSYWHQFDQYLACVDANSANSNTATDARNVPLFCHHDSAFNELTD